MISIYVVIPFNYRPVSLAALMDVFMSVNLFSIESGEVPVFNIRQFKIGTQGIEEVRNHLESPDSHHPSLANGALVSSKKVDLILIPAFIHADIGETLHLNRAWEPWLQHHFEHGTEIATFCSGAFLLAAAGLLDHKKATTHLMYAETFRKLFPYVDLQEESVVTDHSGTYTSGGAISGFNLMLHLIEKYCSRDMSLRIARMFAIDPDRVTQSYFGEFNPPKHKQDTLVSELQTLIEKLYREDISISELAESLPASRRTLYRRFKEATGMTPFRYLQKIRIEAAKKMLVQTNHNVSEVMYNSGYSDPKSFRNLFKENVGLAPGNYRKKYQPVSNAHRNTISK